jgi:hypothetical protein
MAGNVTGGLNSEVGARSLFGHILGTRRITQTAIKTFLVANNDLAEILSLLSFLNYEIGSMWVSCN